MTLAAGSTPLPDRNGHTGRLDWDLPTFTVVCRTCPGRRTDLPLVVDQWEAGGMSPSDRPDMSWKRHTVNPPPPRLPTLAELRERAS